MTQELIERLQDRLATAEHALQGDNEVYADALALERETIDALQSQSARIAELEGERSFVWKWVERGLFDPNIDRLDALKTLAHYPGAPWNEGRWDVDHKPYAAAFYERFPKASLTKDSTSGGSDAN